MFLPHQQKRKKNGSYHAIKKKKSYSLFWPADEKG